MRIPSFALLLFACILPASSICAENAKDSLIVYGNDFAFIVKEPAGWHGDIDNAERFNCNVIFYAQSPMRVTLIIRIRVNTKSDEDLEEDLAYDMQGYRKQYPKVTFADIKVSHPTYDVFPKLFYIPEDFYEYVTYINPGIGTSKMLSVSMNLQEREATKEELSAYLQIIESLLFLTEDVRIN